MQTPQWSLPQDCLNYLDNSVTCRHEILGLLLVKDLIVLDKNTGVKAGEVRLRGVPFLQVIIVVIMVFRIVHSLVNQESLQQAHAIVVRQSRRDIFFDKHAWKEV